MPTRWPLSGVASGVWASLVATRHQWHRRPRPGLSRTTGAGEGELSPDENGTSAVPAPAPPAPHAASRRVAAQEQGSQPVAAATPRRPRSLTKRDFACYSAPLLCVAAIIFVEAAYVARGHLLVAEIADAVLLLLLVQFPPRGTNRHVIGRLLRGPRAHLGAACAPNVMALPDASKAAVCALALVPLSRVVALGLPLREASGSYGTLLVSVLVALAAWGLSPTVGVMRRTLFVVRRPLRPQFAAAFAGLLLGLVAYLLGSPALWAPGSPSARVTLALLAGISAAATEEFVFRGVIQGTLQRIAGRLAVVTAAALFASTYLDAGSAGLVLTVAVAGLVFGQAVARTGVLSGAVAGHILLTLGAGAIWPTLLGRTHPSWLSQPGSTIGLALAAAGMTTLVLRRPITRNRG